jgi:hypothetical protein
VQIKSVNRKYNPDQKIVLTGLFDIQKKAYAKWALLDDSINLDDVKLVDTTKQFSKGSGLSYQIAMKENSFVAGLSYTFKFSVSYDESNIDESQTFSTVAIIINAPPANGIFTVKPSSGVAFNDTYTFKTADWIDDSEDYPLIASFSYYTLSPINAIIVKGSDEIWQLDTSLGQGLASMDYSVVCVTVCKDFLSSENTLQVTTTVNEAAATEVLFIIISLHSLFNFFLYFRLLLLHLWQLMLPLIVMTLKLLELFWGLLLVHSTLLTAQY